MPDAEFRDLVTVKIVAFLREIGLEVRTAEIGAETVLPGIDVDHGAILIDESKLTYPGDLLHEAGHVAVTPAEKRKRLGGDVGKKASEEMMAIAWSYAAAVHLGLDLRILFHSGGYKGWSESLIENFTQRRYFGVPMLQWVGLTADEKRAKELSVPSYPRMIRWVLD
ncbi:MAG: hypothetical protein AABO41_28325 [Acidobacteriota bacterium]